jgi:hypothetical protein
MHDVTIVDIRDLKEIQQSAGRTGHITAKELPVETGVPSVTMDFDFVTFSKDYGTPRHRHTFDQIRYVVDGVYQSEVGDLDAGEIGYYPEGVHYGPQHQDAPVTVIFLQFPGPSKIPYVKHSALSVARKQLIDEGGSFENGVYTRIFPDGRKINKDSHAACFEKITGKQLEFPQGRTTTPVFMRPQAYQWTPDRRVSGLQHKHLGTFGEWRTAVSMMRLDPGTKLPAFSSEDAEIRYLTVGSISYGGKTWLGGTTNERGTHMYIPHGSEVGEIISEEGATLFRITLPMVADWEHMLQKSAA